jgi:hypothetical protein
MRVREMSVREMSKETCDPLQEIRPVICYKRYLSRVCQSRPLIYQNRPIMYQKRDLGIFLYVKYLYMHERIQICIRVCMLVCVFVCLCVYTYTRIYTC